MGFRAPNVYAGVAGADLENAPQGPVPFTSPFGLPVTRFQTWQGGGTVRGASNGVPGNPAERASGNPAVSTVPNYGPEKSPYGGGGVSSVPQFGRRALTPGWQETDERINGGATGGANDKLITSDRHGIMKVGYENSGRNSGQTDPPTDGPARPSLWLVQRTL